MVGIEEPADEKPVRLGSLTKPEPGVKRLGRLTKVGDVKPVVKQEVLPDGGPPGVGVTRGGIKKTKFEPKIPQRRVKKAPDAANASTSPAADEEWTPQTNENPNLQQRRLGASSPIKGSVPAARVAFGAGAVSSYRSSGGEGRPSGGGSGSKAQGPPRSAKASLGNDVDMLLEPEKKKDKKAKHRPRLDLTSYYPVTLPTGPAPDADAFERMDIDGDAEPGANEAQAEAILSPGDEDRVPAAQELDLNTSGANEKLLFFQLPALLPVQSASENLQGGRKPDDPSTSNPDDGKGGGLASLPEGYMGKLVVYKSGKVKLRLGDVLLDAVPGAKCTFYQEVAAVDVARKECHILGSVPQRVVLTPDIDHLLSGIG